MRRRNAFTLIELITVIAITTILLTIIFVPVIQGFNLTRAAQAFADAQDRARNLIRLIEREVGNGAAVRDNSGNRGAITVVVPGQTAGTFVASTLPFMKLDIYKPSEGDPKRGPSGAFIDPYTGREDPTLQAPKGQVNLPATSGMSLVRYFVGLRNPLLVDAAGTPTAGAPYNNPYDGLLMAVNGQQDNLYVLYRAEVQVKVYDRNLGQYVVNPALFVDANNDGDPDDIDDPAFFAVIPGVDTLSNTNLALNAQGQAKAARMLTWLRKARVVTEVSRYDMIAPIFDKSNRQVVYNNNVPQLVPLVRFQPTRITSEPAASEMAVRSGEEGSNMGKAGPDVYRTKYGAYSSVLVRQWPSIWPANFAANGDRAGNVRQRWGSNPLNPEPPYSVARIWSNAGQEVFSMFLYDPATMTNDLTEGVETFEVSTYLKERKLPKPAVNANPYSYPYAFTDAVAAANARSSWLNNPLARVNFVPFAPDPRNGKVIASFDGREVGSDTSVPWEYRVPTWGQQSASGQTIDLKTGVRVSPFDQNQTLDYTPNNDPDVGTGVWTDPIFEPINRRFNKLWTDFPLLAPGLDRAQYVKRFIDLRVCLQPDASTNALYPNTANGVARAYVTPGSEIIVGPDQRPGPNYGQYVRYTRVSQRPVGPNQYLINYVDQPEPDWSQTGLNLGGVSGNLYDPQAYSATNLIQAILQPQYRAGYVELNSRFGEPIPSGYTDLSGFHPTGNILVTYRFQYTEPNDVVAVDYDSTQVMQVVLTIRNYPQVQNIPNPQTITVKGSAEVRNFVR
ncbi:MAG: prepilin-type N-terminal cleavage/methylation domain-containing protein [Armatimonadetes bacterium]|nr:prepilin-type N-terminal cleavage/methylation domain-containing protein [Armatimonadota bacterium]